MLLLYNGQLFSETDLRLPLSNRAFQYGDGFFETIIINNGQVRFWPQHWERIQEAAAILRLSLPATMLDGSLSQRVVELAQLNDCGQLARVKLKLWRAGDGLYTPQTDEADWLLTVHPATIRAETPLQVGICEGIRTVPSPFSSFKGINAPVYIMASKEKVASGFDDMLLLDPEGHLAELTFSNLFWLHKKILYTPSLQTGCLNGVARRSLLQLAKQLSLDVEEGFYYPDQLLESLTVFAGNVTGIRLINKVKSVNLRQDIHPFFYAAKNLFR